MSYTAKSIILDIADNYGYSGVVGIRSIDFYLVDVLVANTDANLVGYATTTFANYKADWSFDTTLSKTGAGSNNCWASDSATIASRLIAVFDSTIEFDKMVINNYHHNGGLTDAGAKNVKINISSDTITSTVYDEAIANSEVIFDGVFLEHSVSDAEDAQTLFTADSYLSKSVILDIADDWGNTDYLGIRSIDFCFEGSKISNLVTTDFVAYSTSKFSSSYNPEFSFDTSKSKTGTYLNSQWISGNTFNTNQRLICVFNSLCVFDEIRINNSHHQGTTTDTGSKNVKIYTSSDEITSTVYDETIANSESLFDGVFLEHVASDVEDEQILSFRTPVQNTFEEEYIITSDSYFAKSIVLDIADNWGDPTYTAARSIEFTSNGLTISVAPADITVSQNKADLAGYDIEQMFDTSLAKDGSHIGTCWGVTGTTNIRVIVVFDTAIEFDGITFNNFLGWTSGPTGFEEDYGIKNVKIHCSTDSITSTTYDEAIANSILIFDDTVDIHSTTNQVEDQELSLSHTLIVPGEWSNKIDITIDHTLIDSDLTHFPVPIVLGSSVGIGNFDASDIFDKLGSNSKKIAVTKEDGTTQLFIEIENWGSGKAVLRVSRDEFVISSTVDTKLVLYYDPSQDDNYYVGDVGDLVSQIVWDGDFLAVYHMSQDPSGGSDCILDSTANVNHGTPIGTWTLSKLVDGNIGKALDFTGGIYIDVPDSVSLDLLTGQMTFEAIIDLDVFSNNGILTKSNLANNAGIFQLAAAPSGWQFGLNTGAKYVQGGTPSSGWKYMVVKYDLTTMTLFEDAVSIGTEAYSAAVSTDNNLLRIGVYYSSSYTTDGRIGGIRISKTDRSDDWITVTNYAETDTLLSLSFPSTGIPLNTFEEPYSIFGDVIFSLYEEPYSLASSIVNTIEEYYTLTHSSMLVLSEIYGLKMSVDLVQWYSDTPVLKGVVNEYYSDAPILTRDISLRYDNVLVPLRNFIEVYGDKPFAVNFISVLYEDAPVHKGVYHESYNDAVVTSVLKTLIYGDKPSADKLYNEYYGDAKVLVKSVDQKYQDSLKAYNKITETYDFNTGAQLIINQSWGIAGTGIVKTFEEAYELDVLNPVSSTFDMSYYLVSEAAIENAVEVTITVNEVPIDFISVDIEAGMDKYVIVGKIEVATEADYINSPLDGDVECIIDGVTFNLFIETRGKSKTNAGGISWTIDMLSPTAKLDSPYSKTMVETFTNNILASELVQQMADYQGITVDWDLPLDVLGDPIDWNIPNYAISANDETPLAVIKKVVNAIGAIIQTKPNGDMLIISRYPVSPTLWNLTTPSVIFSSETDIVSITDSIVINEGLNAFLITDQGSSAANITLEEIEINNTTKIVRGFRIPFDEGPFDLVTSGGPLISVVKDSNYIEANLPEDFNEDEEWEYVEFIDWVGTTSYPIYEIIESQWVTENMGSFTPSENGTLTVDTQNDNLKESLLRIKYKTKYWKWTVRGPVGAYAQVYVPELETT